MAQEESYAKKKARRRRCVILSVVAVLLLVIVLAVVLALTLRPKTGKSESLKQTTQETFIARCEEFKGYDCQKLWGAFEKAYVGRDPCKVPVEAYDPFIAATHFQPACSRMLFWSKTKDVVHDFTEKKDCFVTVEDTVLGAVVDGLTWCGKEGSRETFSTGCPGWTDCDNNPVRSYWNRVSAAFAEAACGDVTAMLNGSISTPFSTTSIFASIEVPRFNSTKVRSLNVVLVTQEKPMANCTNASFKELQKELDRGIEYKCTEVPESELQECSSNAEKPCGACW